MVPMRPGGPTFVQLHRRTISTRKSL